MARNSKGGLSEIDEFPSVGSGDFGTDASNDEKNQKSTEQNVSTDAADKTSDEKEPKENKEGSEADKATSSVTKTDDSDTQKSVEGDEKDKKSDDAKEENETEYFENEAGDIVDKTGNVIVHKDDVQRDKDGNVLIPEIDEAAELVNNIAKSVSSKFGIELKDENGKPLKFDGTDEGLGKLAETVVDTVLAQREEALFEEYPEVKRYMNHLAAGGQPQEYFKHVEETTTKFDLPADDAKAEKDHDTRKNVIREEYLIKNGYYDTNDSTRKAAILDRANRHVNRIADSGDDEIIAEAKYAKGEIEAAITAKRQAKEAADQARIQQAQEEQRKYIDTIKNTVKGRKLNSISVPENDVNGFIDYLTKPVNPKGQTKEMLDVVGEDLQKSLELAYIRYKGFNLDDLIENRVNRAKVERIKARKVKPTMIKGGSGDKPKPTGDLDIITIDKLIN